MNKFSDKLPLWYRQFVLSMEGGLVNHPRDPGGLTNKGVTLATFKRLAQIAKIKIDQNENVVDRLKALTDHEWSLIQDYFYDLATHGGKMPLLCSCYATELMWWSGNVFVLQRAVANLIHKYKSDLGEVPPGFIDGYPGPTTSKTTAMVAAVVGELNVCEEIYKVHIGWVGTSLCQWRPEFCEGWSRRCREFIVLLRNNNNNGKAYKPF